mgnify:FL=1
MTKPRRKSIKNIFIIVLILIILIGVYSILMILLYNSTEIVKSNEFGDYIGGVLNPLFTLLSTVSIIYLTYIISQNEDRKAEKSIETQKRITLNQMRQDSLNRLSDKLNMFAYELDKLNIASSNYNNLTKAVIANTIKKENKEKSFVWIVILNELDNFSQNEYLFANLFKEKDFIDTYNSLGETLSTLCNEQSEKILIEEKSLENYIELKQRFITLIGNYIYSNFND